MTDQIASTYKKLDEATYKSRARANLRGLFGSAAFVIYMGIAAHQNLDVLNAPDESLTDQATQAAFSHTDLKTTPAVSTADGKTYEVTVTNVQIHDEITKIRDDSRHRLWSAGILSGFLGLLGGFTGVQSFYDRRNAKRAADGWDQKQAAASAPPPPAPSV